MLEDLANQQATISIGIATFEQLAPGGGFTRRQQDQCLIFPQEQQGVLWEEMFCLGSRNPNIAFGREFDP